MPTSTVVGRSLPDCPAGLADEKTRKALPRPPGREDKKGYREIIRAIRQHATDEIKDSDERLIAFVEEYVRELLEIARPTIFHRRGQLEWQLGLLVRLPQEARTLLAALSLQLILDAYGSNGLSYCFRCDKPYIRAKQGQQFCSLKCGNNDRQARRRLKLHRKAG